MEEADGSRQVYSLYLLKTQQSSLISVSGGGGGGGVRCGKLNSFCCQRNKTIYRMTHCFLIQTLAFKNVTQMQGGGDKKQ